MTNPRVARRATSTYIQDREHLSPGRIAERRWGARQAQRDRDKLSQYIREGVVRGLYARPQALKARDLGLKVEVLTRYGAMCHCCGEGEVAFLTLDDPDCVREIIDGPGLWAQLKRMGYPDRFIVTCFNCQVASLTLDGCPHRHGVAEPVL